jgi:hypothetical protein
VEGDAGLLIVPGGPDVEPLVGDVEQPLRRLGQLAFNDVTPKELLANKKTYDRCIVRVEGEVKGVRGNKNYVAFFLRDGDQELNVYAPGGPEVNNGDKVVVTGQFWESYTTANVTNRTEIVVEKSGGGKIELKPLQRTKGKP